MENDILYDLTPWEDVPSTLTPINAENLNARDSLLKKVVDKTNQLQEQINDLQNGGTGLNDTAKNLLITILRNGLYTVDQSGNITALETALSSGADIPDTPVEPEQPEIGIVQTGSILAITSGVTATQTGSVLAIA